MGLPAYKQIQQYILQAIASGELKAGDKIPTEFSLAEQFSVSRMTVNKAIVALSEKNILKRQAGKGTYVADQKNALPFLTSIDFAKDVISRGKTYSARVLVHDKRRVYDAEATQLSVANSTYAGYCEILHLENNEPLILECRFVNLSQVEGFMMQDFTEITPAAFLLERHPLTEMEHTIDAIIPDTDVSELLALPNPSACLQILRRTWSNDVLISFANLIATGNKYRLHARNQLD